MLLHLPDTRSLWLELAPEGRRLSLGVLMASRTQMPLQLRLLKSHLHLPRLIGLTLLILGIRLSDLFALSMRLEPQVTWHQRAILSSYRG